MTEKTKEKHVLIFSAQWCSPCRQMKSNVLSDSKVKQRLSEYDSVQYLDIDESNGRQLSAAYRVSAVPTVIIVNEEGRPKKMGQFMNTYNFLEFLK